MWKALRHNLLLRWIDAKFIHRPKTYLGQAFVAGAILVGIMVFEDTISNGIIVAAAASSLATVFFMPHSLASSPYRIVGGHISGVLAGLSTVGIMLLLPDQVAANVWAGHALQGASLALVILFMTVTNTEHTPAAGTALGLASSVPGDSVIFILSAAVIIALVRIVLFRRLHNLI